ncbi:MAG TPA: hypothetical protein VFJ62_07095 [Usitatibacter sp.]|nr:hypothetical protein [Usitatibacter sp.]
MTQVFSKEGFGSLAGAWLVLGLAIVTAGSVIAASQWYLQRQRVESGSLAGRLQAARTRLDTAQRERSSLQESVEVFRTLVERGLLQNEHRLDLVEMVNELRARHQLFALDYEISPQRPLTLSGGRAFPSVDVLGSRVRLHVKALHEGDIIGFIDDIVNSRQGFYTVDRCYMRRMEEAPGADRALVPHVEAECALEWITLREKRGNRPA